MPSRSRGRRTGEDRQTSLWRDYEKLAADFFKQQGFQIIERNWRTGRLEIDVIVRKEDLLVFVEVKSASTRKFGHPAERVDEKKTANLIRAARQYLIDKSVENCDLRFDVVTFVDGQLEHFPSAFVADE